MLFEELLDAEEYVIRSYLRLPSQKKTQQNAMSICAAASFLFDRQFAKEDAGKDLTQLAYEQIGKEFDAKSLSSYATKIRLAMSGPNFSLGGTPIRDYWKWIGEEVPEVKEAIKDEEGLLALATIDELASLLSEDYHDVPSLRISEYLFLNLTVCFFDAYRRLYGNEKFRQKASFPYFQDVEKEFENIRKDIVD